MVRRDAVRALAAALFVVALAVQGAAVSISPLWAAPALALLAVALAVEIPLAPFIATALVVRVLTDASLSSPDIRHTGAVNLSSAIAIAFLLVAAGLVMRRRPAVGLAALACLWLVTWTGVAVATHGAAVSTVREGVREASVIALATIVLSSRRPITVRVAARIVQLAGAGSALLAVYQYSTHTGMLILGQARANGTFVHPDGAAMYFAIAATASVWLFLDRGHRRADMAAAVLFGAATIATFSIGGLASLLVMLIALGALRPGAFRAKLASGAVVIIVAVAFLATPLGAERLSSESSTSLSFVRSRGEGNSSLAWRLYKWQSLLGEWETSPLIGHGLGTTVTVTGTSENESAGKVPHNEYVRYLVETGAVGLLLMLAAALALFRRLARIRRGGPPGNGATLSIAILTGCMFNALGDNTILYTTTAYALALIVAASLACVPRQASHGQ